MRNSCEFESMTFGQGNSLFDVNGDTITAKPHLFSELKSKFSFLNEEVLAVMCSSCGLCQPEITFNSAQRLVSIRRNDYMSFPEDPTPQERFTRMEFTANTTPQQARLLIIDDNWSYATSLSTGLAWEGYSGDIIVVNDEYAGKYGVESNTEKLLDMIWERGMPTHVICDKNIGSVHTFNLLTQLSGFTWTIMVTGEQHTREAHRVADILIEKTDDSVERIHQTIQSHFYPKQV